MKSGKNKDLKINHETEALDDPKIFTLTNSTESTGNKDLEESLPNTSKFSKCVQKISDSYIWITISGLALFYSLIGDEVRRAAYDKDNDDTFFIFACVILCIFVLELPINWIAHHNYRWSYWCFIDILGVVSIIPDIGYIWNPIVGSYCLSYSGKEIETGYPNLSLKFVRIARLFRILKLYKLIMLTVSKKKNKAEDVYDGSKVGVILADSMNKSVITLIIFLLAILPFFEYDYYENTSESWNYGLILLTNFAKQRDFEMMYQKYLDVDYLDYFTVLYIDFEYEDGNFKVSRNWARKDFDMDEIRESEMMCINYKNSTVILDMRYHTQLEAYLSLSKTLTMCFIMIISAMFLNKDVRDFVITPAEKAILWIKSISNTPLSLRNAKSMPKSETEDETLNKCCIKVKIAPNYEVQILENTLLKMSKLTSLCFGEDEAKVIETGMNEKWRLSPSAKGRKFYAIFGICSVESMAEFQPDLFIFINKIASIVHHVADQYMCDAILNLGWNFILIWKIDDSEIKEKEGKLKFMPSSAKSTFLADLAFISLMKISAKIITDKNIERFTKDSRVLKGKTKYNRKLGFSLHVGSGIEGCIGSDYKIDTGYISNDLNACLELAKFSRQNENKIVVSDSLYDMLSPEGKGVLKLIDTEEKDNEEYMRIYKANLNCSVPPLKMKKREFEKCYLDKKSELMQKLDGGEVTGKYLYEMSKCVRLMKRIPEHI
ncbi:unnamed protein product [Blepharisma stoltei]|uniref:Guanylate cyclase domain-containing protein n=1 Tax=Blepharisma stoltei TaxID=1481888 RepID=A0AAU9K495_9CILI|nr:unnamed protein product [Blepharisma stoltei]